MRTRLGLCGLSLVVVLASISCGNSTSGPSGGGIVQSCAGSGFSGTMTATINGQSFAATCLLLASSSNNIVALGGTDISANNKTTYQDISIAIVATAPGTYSLASLASGLPNPNNASYSIGGSQQWLAGSGFGGTSSVTITTLTATSVSGTFSITFAAGPGGSGTKTLTNGAFNITF